VNADELIDRYCMVWSDPDPDVRAKLLESVWAPNGTYTDPKVEIAGADALLEHIANVQRLRPGAKVLRTSRVDEHHSLARFAWHVVLADGTALPKGLDIAFLDGAGMKITRVIGFFGPLEDELSR
jgi:hypothetical protein